MARKPASAPAAPDHAPHDTLVGDPRSVVILATPEVSALEVAGAAEVFALAEAGLLDRRRVTTHWYFCERQECEFPRVMVDPEPILVRADPLWTAAGVTAGIDMALAMVEDDPGLDIALRVARALVVYVRRPGWQSQFSTALASRAPRRTRLSELPLLDPREPGAAAHRALPRREQAEPG